MSTEQATSAAERQHKVVNLYGEQISHFRTAKEIAEEKIGESLTEGQAVQLACACYLEEQTLPALYYDLVDGHASENGDQVFTATEVMQLHQLDNSLLRRLASRSESDDVSGRSTKTELCAYFAKRDSK